MKTDKGPRIKNLGRYSGGFSGVLWCNECRKKYLPKPKSYENRAQFIFVIHKIFF